MQMPEYSKPTWLKKKKKKTLKGERKYSTHEKVLTAWLLIYNLMEYKTNLGKSGWGYKCLNGHSGYA